MERTASTTDGQPHDRDPPQRKRPAYLTVEGLQRRQQQLNDRRAADAKRARQKPPGELPSRTVASTQVLQRVPVWLPTHTHGFKGFVCWPQSTGSSVLCAAIQQNGALMCVPLTRFDHQQQQQQQQPGAGVGHAGPSTAAEQVALKSACAHARPHNSDRSAVGGLGHEFLVKCYQAEHQWRKFEQELIGCMKACAWCGRVAFGGRHSMLQQGMRLTQATSIPAGVWANPTVLAHGLAHVGSSGCYQCQTCRHQAKHGKANSRAQFQQRATAAEVEALRTIYQLDAGYPLLLGVIKCGVKIAQRINGFLHAEAVTDREPLLDGPLITYDATSGYTREQMAALLQTAVRQQRDMANPVISRYLTVLEQRARTEVQPSAAQAGAGPLPTDEPASQQLLQIQWGPSID